MDDGRLFIAENVTGRPRWNYVQENQTMAVTVADTTRPVSARVIRFLPTGGNHRRQHARFRPATGQSRSPDSCVSTV